MRKDEYLGDPSVASFLVFLRSMVVHGFPELALRIGPSGQREEVGTLIDVWLSDRLPGGVSAQQRAVAIAALMKEMRSAMSRCAEAHGEREQDLAGLELLYVAVRALALGGSPRDAHRYLLHCADTGDLWPVLTEAAGLLDGSAADLRQLSAPRLRFDFGLSHVYALMKPATVIYDDRLGAALGLLCRWHLQRTDRHTVPTYLNFMVGSQAPLRRDPSAERLLFSAPRPGPLHARWNLFATWLVDALARDPVISNILRGTHVERMRQLHAALWVVGDDVADQMAPQSRRRTALYVRRGQPAGHGASAL